MLQENFIEEVLMQLPAQVSILKGPEHIFELVNPPAQELLGERQVIGKPVREALPELEGQGFFEMLDQVYNERQTVKQKSMPASLVRGDETLRLYVDVTYLPLMKNGNVEGVISFSYDVTETVTARKQAEQAAEELKQAYEDLEVKVKFRTLELERANAALQEKLGSSTQ